MATVMSIPGDGRLDIFEGDDESSVNAGSDSNFELGALE